MKDGLRLAVTTFTVWPVRGPAEVDRGAAGTAMRLAPLVSLLVSLPAALVLVGTVVLAAPLRHHVQLVDPFVHHPVASALAALLAVATTAALTRGLHLDGLADTVDGLGSYRSPERALQLMRRGGSGPLGITALVVDLLLQVGALAVLTDLAPALGAVALVVATAAGRTSVTLACTPRTPAARPDGLGALVAGTVGRRTALGLTTVVVALAAALPLVPDRLAGEESFGFVVDDVASTFVPPTAVQQAAVLVVATVVALALAHLLRAHCVRRFGGMTGDVLGALVEVTTALVLLGAALALPFLTGEAFHEF